MEPNNTANSMPAAENGRSMKTFLIIWLGELVSVLGSGLTNFALGVWIYTETGQATPFAITILLGSLPRILLMPVAGSLADRWNRRMLMIAADTGSAVVTLGVFLLLLTNGLQIWNIYLLAFLSSAISAFQEPAYLSSVTMLVPKKHLARASGMINIAQSLELVIAPVIAGALFVTIGFRGIILIDFITFFFAIGALLLVRIPQPALSASDQKAHSVWQDAVFGWNYLRARPGLFLLLWYFALTNFLLNLSAVLQTPLVLSFSLASTLGAIQSAGGFGMLLGSIIMSAWGGPKRKINGTFLFISMAAVSLAVIGLKPNPYFIGTGLFFFLACIPLASGCSQAIFQTKIEPSVQGRVFAVRSMISQSIMPVAFLSAGPLADLLFNPLLLPGGALAGTAIGQLLETGPGRGVGLIYVLCGLILLVASFIFYLSPRIRRVETELPDAVTEEAAPVPEPAQPGLAGTSTGP